MRCHQSLQRKSGYTWLPSSKTLADVFSASKRSQIMAAIKGKDSKSERAVRSLIHRMGFRFRLHGSDLPGKPDLVFPRLKKVIFVHGCFWHGHVHCRRSKLPSTNRNFWLTKIQKNKFRDSLVRGKLTKLGWESLILWQCQVNKIQGRYALQKKIKRFLES